MTHSDWGDWLLREIEDASPERLSVWYLGCNGLAIKGRDGTTIFVDPYLGTGDPPRTVRMIPVPFDASSVREADAVFATHEHTDHVHGPSQAPILENTDATFIGPGDSVDVARREERWHDTWDIDEKQFAEVSSGDSIDVGSFTVHVETANDPDASQPVSYVFEYNGVTVFHGGDTKPDAAFERIGREYDIDLGVLAFGSVGMIPDKETREPVRTQWYNDENDVIEIASALQLETLLPSHWDMWRGLTADPSALHHHVHSFEYPRSLEIVRIGDRVEC